jgi:DNA replication ATP-dependent helicase Dna2
MVDTVDRFQGSECDVVILSFANWNEEVHDLLRDERRLNVALTRARHKLILVGSRRVLRTVPVYARLMEEVGDSPSPPAPLPPGEGGRAPSPSGRGLG